MSEYDKKISKLEEEIKQLRQQEAKDKKAALKSKLDAAIDNLKKYNEKAFCFYVGKDIFDSIQSGYYKVWSLFSCISTPVKYRGYTVYENYNLADDEVQVSFNYNEYLVKHCCKISY